MLYFLSDQTILDPNYNSGVKERPDFPKNRQAEKLDVKTIHLIHRSMDST